MRPLHLITLMTTLLLLVIKVGAWHSSPNLFVRITPYYYLSALPSHVSLNYKTVKKLSKTNQMRCGCHCNASVETVCQIFMKFSHVVCSERQLFCCLKTTL